MVTLNAHFDGKTIVVDEPFSLQLRIGARLKLNVELMDEDPALVLALSKFLPLEIRIDADLSNAIAMDPQFDIEES